MTRALHAFGWLPAAACRQLLCNQPPWAAAGASSPLRSAPACLPAGPCNDTSEGYWVWTGALVTAKGPRQREAELAKVDASAITVPRGGYTIKVRCCSLCAAAG